MPNEAAYGRAPQRAPVFYRSNALDAPHVVPQYGYQAHVQQAYVQQVPQAHAPQPFRQAPPAPNSLAPMAMNTPRSAASTGSNRAIETVLIRERPTMRSGMMILLVGVLAGGLVGIAMRAHRNALDAATAPEAPVVAAQAPVTPPPVVQPAAPNVVPPVAQPAAPPIRPVVAAVVPTQPPLVVPPSKAEKREAKADPKLEAKAEKTEKKHAPSPVAAPRPVVAAAPVGAHPRIATNVTPPKPEKAEKAEKVEKPEKPEKTAKGGKDKAPSDAANILKAAMGETENTL